MQKREFLTGGVLAVAAATLPGRATSRPSKSSPAGQRLNVLIITVDDMDYSVMGYMGNTHGLTPHLDALAAKSHVFVNNRGAAPICMPSRQAFMSGLVPHRNSLGGFDPMHEGTPSICSILQKAGWHTAASHKTEHMQPPSSFPWDEKVAGKDRNILVHAAAFKHAVAAAKAQGVPFFINCNINDPHRPFYGSPGAAQLDHNDQGPFGIPRLLGPKDVEVPAHLDDLPDVRRELSQYWNSVQRADIAIGQLLKALDESGEAERTVVVFCNDHGMPFPFSKTTAYDHGTRVPALVKYPGMKAPRRFDTMACNVDIMPTVLDLLGVPIPQDIDGRSWLPRMRGDAVADPEFVLTYVNGMVTGTSYPVRTIQDQRYSLMYQPWSDGEFRLKVEPMSGLTFAAMQAAAATDSKIAERVRQYVYGVPVALYDRQVDPGQRHNLIDDPAQRSRIARMRDALLTEMERTRDPQLANIRTMIAGGKPVVVQKPKGAGRKGGGRRGKGNGDSEQADTDA